jgi:hypothetical protein
MPKSKHTKHKWTAEENEQLKRFMKEKKPPKWIQNNIFPELTTNAIKSHINRLKNEGDSDEGSKITKDNNQKSTL